MLPFDSQLVVGVPRPAAERASHALRPSRAQHPTANSSLPLNQQTVNTEQVKPCKDMLLNAQLGETRARPTGDKFLTGAVRAVIPFASNQQTVNTEQVEPSKDILPEQLHTAGWK
jgi:hypothetical protein